MKINYATSISCFPLKLPGVGTIKSPTLKEIWELDVTCKTYTLYLSLLSIDLKTYCEKINSDNNDWYNLLSDEEKQTYNIFQAIIFDHKLQNQYKTIFEFFLEENVIWDYNAHVFYTYIADENGEKIVPVGIIDSDTWVEVCDVILQMNGIQGKAQKKELKFKNELAREIWELTHSEDDLSKENSKFSLVNILSSVVAKDESLNMINVWDLTVNQLYDQFRRHQINSFYEISAMSVAAYGDEHGKFDSDAWYENIYKD